MKLSDRARGLRRQSDAIDWEHPGEVLPAMSGQPKREEMEEKRIFSYGVARNRLRQAADQSKVPIKIVNELEQSELVVTLRHHFRKRPQPLVEAEDLGIPLYVLRSDTRKRLIDSLRDLFNLSSPPTGAREEEEALKQTQRAIHAVLDGERWVELDPTSSYIRRLQHQMARQANLQSYSHGKEPNRRVRIYRE